jgi:predicted transcriptional regulator
VPKPKSTKRQNTKPQNTKPQNTKPKIEVSNNQLSEYQHQQNKDKVAELYRRGLTRRYVAKQLNVSESQVAKYWKEIVAEYREDREDDIESAVFKKLEEYGEIKREAWEAWEKSKDPIEKELYETVTSDFGVKTLARRYKEGRLPHSAYLEIIMSCIKEERVLLGLNPVKNVTGSMAIGGVSFDWDLFVQEVNRPNLRNEAEERIYEGLPRVVINPEPIEDKK